MTRRAFTWDDGAAENAMIDAFRVSAEYRAGWSLVAEHGGVVVGHVLAAPLDLLGDEQNAARARRVLNLGPLSVHPEWQRQGIGSALMRDIMRCLHDSGEAMVVLWGHAEYYPRFGFRPATDFGLLPDTPAAMVCPLQPDVGVYAGLRLPT